MINLQMNKIEEKVKPAKIRSKRMGREVETVRARSRHPRSRSGRRGGEVRDCNMEQREKRPKLNITDHFGLHRK